MDKAIPKWKVIVVASLIYTATCAMFWFTWFYVAAMGILACGTVFGNYLRRIFQHEGEYRLYDALLDAEKSIRSLVFSVRRLFYRYRILMNFIVLILLFKYAMPMGIEYMMPTYVSESVAHDLTDVSYMLAHFTLVAAVIYIVALLCLRYMMHAEFNEDDLRGLIVKLRESKVKIPYKHVYGVQRIDADALLDLLAEHNMGELYATVRKYYRHICELAVLPFGESPYLIERLYTQSKTDDE